MDLKLILENPDKTTKRRNRNADRCLKLEESAFRVHLELLHNSPVLEKLLMKGARTMMHLDHLKMDQKYFTPVGLNMAIEWLYGTRITFSTEHLTDALAAAFALEMYDMVEALEQAVLKYKGEMQIRAAKGLITNEWLNDDPEALVILLYHIDNFTPETKQQLLTASAAQIAAVSQMRPFVGLLPSIFKRVMKIAMNNLAETGNAFSVARAIILWTAENQHRDLAMSLLKQITIESLSNADAHTLQRLAVESGLECVAALIFSRYHVTSPVARRLFHDEAESSRTTTYISEQHAVWELPPQQKGRLAAGKNVTTDDKVEHEQEQKAIHWAATPEDQHRISKMMTKLDAVHFGTIALDGPDNDFVVEIVYEGPREAAKDDAVKLYFDFEFDQESVPA